MWSMWKVFHYFRKPEDPPQGSDRVKDTDFGDIFDLSPISVLFTQILYEGESYRYLWQNCFSIYLNRNQNLCLSFQQYMFYVSYRFWWQILFPDWTFLVKLLEVSQISVTSTHIFIKGVIYWYLLQFSINFELWNNLEWKLHILVTNFCFCLIVIFFCNFSKGGKILIFVTYLRDNMLMLINDFRCPCRRNPPIQNPPSHFPPAKIHPNF